MKFRRPLKASGSTNGRVPLKFALQPLMKGALAACDRYLLYANWI